MQEYFKKEFTDETMSIIKKIALKMDLEVKIEKWMDCDPIAMDKELVDIIKNKCSQKGLDYKVMHSGAGHDSQIFAKVMPTVMIFVPSHKGISHSPHEYTEPEDLVEGVKALIQALYCLAYK